MTKVRPLLSSVCRDAWDITLGAIYAASQKAHCQFRGAVVVLEPVTGAIVFTAPINNGTDPGTNAFFGSVAFEVAEASYAVRKALTLESSLEMVGRAALKGGMVVAVAMCQQDSEYARAFARTMASMLVVGQTITLDRNPPKDESDSNKTEDEQSEDQAVPDDGPPTLILAPMRRSVGGL